MNWKLTTPDPRFNTQYGFHYETQVDTIKAVVFKNRTDERYYVRILECTHQNRLYDAAGDPLYKAPLSPLVAMDVAAHKLNKIIERKAARHE